MRGSGSARGARGDWEHRMITVSIALGALGVILFLLGLVRPSPAPAGSNDAPAHPLEKALARFRHLARTVTLLLTGDVSERVLDAFVIGAVFVFVAGIIVAIHFLWRYVEFIRDYWFALIPILLVPAITQALIFRYIERPAHVPRRLGGVLSLVLILNVLSIGIGALPTLVLLYLCAAALAVPFAIAYGFLWALRQSDRALNPTGTRGFLWMGMGGVFLLAAVGLGIAGAVF